VTGNIVQNHPKRVRGVRLSGAARAAALQGDLGCWRHEWRNPDEDLPDDFESHRVEHYDKLHKSLDPAAFTAQLRDEMRTELAALNDALPGLDWLRITDRKSGAIKLTPPDAQPETQNRG
jgi:hypothetical protein